MELAYIITGIIITIVGLWILLKRSSQAKILGIFYEQKRKDYDKEYVSANKILKPFLSIFRKTSIYYDTEESAKQGLLFVGLLSLILGLGLVLLGFGVVR